MGNSHGSSECESSFAFRLHLKGLWQCVRHENRAQFFGSDANLKDKALRELLDLWRSKE